MITVDNEVYYVPQAIKPKEKVRGTRIFQSIASVCTKIGKTYLAEIAQEMAKLSNKTTTIDTVLERAKSITLRDARTEVNMHDLIIATMMETGIQNQKILQVVTRLGVGNSPLYSPLVGNILPDALEAVIVGRSNEIAKVAMMMNKRSRIIALVGNKGVGKNSIVTGVAKAIASGKFPSLHSAILDLNRILDFTAKLAPENDAKRIFLPTAMLEDKNCYVYINHEQFARSVNIMDAIVFLIDNGLNIILNTTADYIKHVEKNANLFHHIERLDVEQMPKDLALQAIKISKPRIEEKYMCEIPDSICEFTMSISSRFPMEQSQPGRTLTILEQAVAVKRLGNLDTIENLNKTDISKLLLDQKYQEAKELITTNHDYIMTGLKISRIIVEEKDISDLMVSHLGISPNVPAGAITSDSIKQLSFLETYVNEYVFGQKEAVKAICDSIRRKALNMTTEHTPPSFLLVGTTGTGKTYTAKKIAELMFGSENALIRIDMSEYTERHTISKLVGAPPGYVGYEDGGQLTDKVRKRPHSVILLDEIEKAHKEVLNILLQVLSDGRLTDGKGRTVSFSESIIIMTSNLGTKSQVGDIGFGADTTKITKTNVMDSVKAFFSPELFNRIGRIVMYNSLGKEEIRRIILREQDIASKNTKFKLQFTEKVTAYLEKKIADNGNVEIYGGREVNRLVQEHLFDQVTEMILKYGKTPTEVSVDYDTELKVSVK